MMRPVEVVVVFLFGAACAAIGVTTPRGACGQTLPPAAATDRLPPAPRPAAPPVEALPPAGYLGIDTTRAAEAAAAERDAKAERRSQAQQAAARRTRQRLARYAPAAGGDDAHAARLAATPHVLWILRRTEQTTRTPLKYPTPAAPGTPGAGPGGVPPLALVMTSDMSAITHQEFGDRGACMVSLELLAEHVDPDESALYCAPLRTR
ncbi:MAG: hypothetical protein AB7F67_04010 [Rhodospirillaceae bacterium]